MVSECAECSASLRVRLPSRAHLHRDVLREARHDVELLLLEGPAGPLLERVHLGGMGRWGRERPEEFSLGPIYRPHFTSGPPVVKGSKVRRLAKK